MKLFSNWNYSFLDTLILYIFFLIIKTRKFQGDLNDVSAESATLLASTSLLIKLCDLRASSQRGAYAPHAPVCSFSDSLVVLERSERWGGNDL